MEPGIIKVDNPDYIRRSLLPLVIELAEILAQPGSDEFSILAYFDAAMPEIWAAHKGNPLEPIGFIVFNRLNFPHYSMGMCNYFYMKDKDPELTQQLYAKFPEYLKKYNLKYFCFHSQSRKLGERFKEEWGKLGLETLKKEYLYTGKRVLGVR